MTPTRPTLLLMSMLLGAAGLVLSSQSTARQPVSTEPALPVEPTSAPATLPTQGDWFAPGASGDSGGDVFTRLYPRLASADRTLRAQTPRLVFDAMGTVNKPPSSKMSRIFLTGNVFTDASKRAYDHSHPRDPRLLVPDERKARIAAVEARQAGGMPICFDIEDLPLDRRIASAADVDRSVREIARVVHWARAQDPSVRVFMYSFLPMTNVYHGYDEYTLATTQPSGQQYPWWMDNADDIRRKLAAWRDANAHLRQGDDRAVGLADLFDAVCPSLYVVTGSGDAEHILSVKAFVRMHMEEARKYGKPIYPFIWPRYFDKPAPVELLSWVNLVRETMIHADGVILWDDIRSPWSGPIALRVRIVQLLADAKGELTDRQLYDQLINDYPRDPELPVLRGE